MWETRLTIPQQLEKYKCIWYHSLFTIEQMVKLIDSDFSEKRHSIDNLARTKILFPYVTIYNGIVVDGTHRLLALLRQGYKLPILVIQNGEKK